jgi:hypothetical protein
MRCAAILLGACLGLLPGGCSRQSASRDDETTTDLRSIAKAYESLLSWKNRPPRDIDEIRQFMADLHKDGLCGDPD